MIEELFHLIGCMRRRRNRHPFFDWLNWTRLGWNYSGSDPFFPWKDSKRRTTQPEPNLTHEPLTDFTLLLTCAGCTLLLTCAGWEAIIS